MTEVKKDKLVDYALRQGDSSLILGQRLGECCGHAPMLELDMTLTNISLDLIGQARLFLGYAGELEGKGRGEDELAFLRDALDFRNLLIVEQPNGDFAETVTRQLLFSTFQSLFLEKLKLSEDKQLAAIAEKALKEVAYHRNFARDWTIRLGDGTPESHDRMTAALDRLWGFTDEMFQMDALDREMMQAGIGVGLEALKPLWDDQINAALHEAGLERPADRRPISGGRKGHHSEHLGHILSEMQFLQRAYPGAEW